jgi:hypothetical protein
MHLRYNAALAGERVVQDTEDFLLDLYFDTRL